MDGEHEPLTTVSIKLVEGALPGTPQRHAPTTARESQTAPTRPAPARLARALAPADPDGAAAAAATVGDEYVACSADSSERLERGAVLSRAAVERMQQQPEALTQSFVRLQRERLLRRERRGTGTTADTGSGGGGGGGGRGPILTIMIGSRAAAEENQPSALSAAGLAAAAGAAAREDGEGDAESGGGGEKFCPICMESNAWSNLARRRHWRSLECGHEFHGDCVESWFATTSTPSCPLCRSESGGGASSLPPPVALQAAEAALTSRWMSAGAAAGFALQSAERPLMDLLFLEHKKAFTRLRQLTDTERAYRQRGPLFGAQAAPRCFEGAEPTEDGGSERDRLLAEREMACDGFLALLERRQWSLTSAVREIWRGADLSSTPGGASSAEIEPAAIISARRIAWSNLLATAAEADGNTAYLLLRIMRSDEAANQVSPVVRIAVLPAACAPGALQHGSAFAFECGAGCCGVMLLPLLLALCVLYAQIFSSDAFLSAALTAALLIMLQWLLFTNLASSYCGRRLSSWWAARVGASATLAGVTRIAAPAPARDTLQPSACLDVVAFMLMQVAAVALWAHGLGRGPLTDEVSTAEARAERELTEMLGFSLAAMVLFLSPLLVLALDHLCADADESERASTCHPRACLCNGQRIGLSFDPDGTLKLVSARGDDGLRSEHQEKQHKERLAHALGADASVFSRQGTCQCSRTWIFAAVFLALTATEFLGVGWMLAAQETGGVCFNSYNKCKPGYFAAHLYSQSYEHPSAGQDCYIAQLSGGGAQGSGSINSVSGTVHCPDDFRKRDKDTHRPPPPQKGWTALQPKEDLGAWYYNPHLPPSLTDDLIAKGGNGRPSGCMPCPAGTFMDVCNNAQQCRSCETWLKVDYFTPGTMSDEAKRQCEVSNTRRGNATYLNNVCQDNYFWRDKDGRSCAQLRTPIDECGTAATRRVTTPLSSSSAAATSSQSACECDGKRGECLGETCPADGAKLQLTVGSGSKGTPFSWVNGEPGWSLSCDTVYKNGLCDRATAACGGREIQIRSLSARSLCCRCASANEACCLCGGGAIKKDEPSKQSIWFYTGLGCVLVVFFVRVVCKIR